MEYHLILSADLGVLQRSICVDLHARVKEIKRMLTSLIQRVNDPRGLSHKKDPTTEPD